MKLFFQALEDVTVEEFALQIARLDLGLLGFFNWLTCQIFLRYLLVVFREFLLALLEPALFLLFHAMLNSLLLAFVY